MTNYSIKNTTLILPLCFLLIYFYEIIQTAWISDDAMITLSTVLNFTHGYGPTFNIDERAQAYTHPIWFLLLSFLAFLNNNVFIVTFSLSIVISLISFWLLIWKVRKNHSLAILICLTLILSKAFIDFSTSGLENPLSHLSILLSYFTCYRALHENKRKLNLYLYFFSLSFLFLTRPDLLLIFTPITLYVLYTYKQHSGSGKTIKFVLLGAAPAIIWILFSIYYYGFPLPNTTYAKLSTGIPLDERITQGIEYLRHNLKSDPITFIFILMGIILGLSTKLISLRLISFGIAIYICYVITIGGDFMEGRFLTAPLFASVIVITNIKLPQKTLNLLLALATVLGLFSIKSTLLTSLDYHNSEIGANGIADERGYYYQIFGLLTAKDDTFEQPEWQTGEKKVSMTCGGLGYASILSGPSTHYIDTCALADPLLSRIPAKYDPHWRAGHYTRQIPTDYKESLIQNENRLKDEKLKEYWNSIRIATRSPLNDFSRIFEIIKLNFIKIDHNTLSSYRYDRIPSSSYIPKIKIEEVGNTINDGAWDQPGTIIFYSHVEIDTTKSLAFNHIDVSVDNNDHYQIYGYFNDDWNLLTDIKPVYSWGMIRHKINLKRKLQGIKSLKIEAISGDGSYSMGHLILKLL